MQYHVRHKTRYEFDRKVFFEPHLLRFFPRCSPHLKLLRHELSISPIPAGLSVIEESTGTMAHACWFDGMHEYLEIEAVFSVAVASRNPFAFLIHPSENNQLPLAYESNETVILAASLEANPLNEEMHHFVDGIIYSATRQTLPFVVALNSAIGERCRVVTREDGPPQTPETTFSNREGSCRDLTWLQIHLLRSVGIAARFVSGYFYLDAEEPRWELHAWVEVYLPGAGWFGVDPSHGIVCAVGHIPIAASPIPAQTLPVTGTFRGEATSHMNHQIIIEKNEA